MFKPFKLLFSVYYVVTFQEHFVVSNFFTSNERVRVKFQKTLAPISIFSVAVCAYNRTLYNMNWNDEPEPIGDKTTAIAGASITLVYHFAGLFLCTVTIYARTTYLYSYTIFHSRDLET